MLVQSFLEGQEYVVNTVSHNSKHHLTDIRLCHKMHVSGAGFVAGAEELLSADESVSQALKAYAFKALDLLKIVHGPGHFEIMLTEEGPKIIEMGARIQGGINPEANAVCLSLQQLDKTIDAYLAPSRFLSYHENDYAIKKFSLWVFLISDKTGSIESIPFIDKVKTLDSFFSLQMNVKVGDPLERTIDYYSSPGSVHLVHEDKAILMNDLKKLRQFEREGFVLSKLC